MTAARSRLVLAGLFVLSLPLVNPYVRGDGNGYYAYVRSVVIDRDLDFENEFRRGDPLFREVYFDEQGRLRGSMRSTTGRVINQWAVGPSILWLPFFLAAHALVHVLNLLSVSVAADGFSAPYRWFCAAGTAFYGWLSIVLVRGPALRLAGERAVLLAMLAIWWASSLPVYMYFVPFHVHALSAFAVSLFLWYWLRARPFGFNPRRWIVWGLTAGLMVDVYYLNAIVALPALVELFARRTGDRPSRAVAAGQAAIAFAVGFLIALAPHLIVKWILHGSPLATGYRDEFFWTTPQLWAVGFSPEHGLFLWTPVLLLALLGLIGVWRRDARAGGTLLVVFAIFYDVVASYQNWHGLSSFGNRFFISLTALFVLGLSVLVESSARVAGRVVPMRQAVPVALAVLVAWNLGFMFQWGTNLVPNRGPVDFGVVARHQVTIVPGRMAAFLRRYLVDRAGIARELEHDDRIERERYEQKR